MSKSFKHFSAGNHAMDLAATDQDHTRDLGVCIQMRRDILCDGFNGYLIIMGWQLTYRYWGILLSGGWHENSARFGFHYSSVDEVN